MTSPDNENPVHSDQPYPTVPSRADYPAIERAILARWDDQKTFERSISQRRDSGCDEYVFYDGPPFANGLPHYGHLLTGYVKDVVPRYQTMRGKVVERRFGWDCHGLPAEMQTEKELGVSGRVAITDYGIDRFNDACRTSVLQFTSEWEDLVHRQARWVDFSNDYKTMDVSYMESVIWAFSTLWEKGLIYEAYRVMPYSWGAETPLSNFEIRLDDATRPRQDPALTVAFTFDPDSTDSDRIPEPLRGDRPVEIWAWTTTPWTLPSNLALAVGDSIRYAVVDSPARDALVIVGANALAKYENELGDGYQVVAELLGSELAELRYVPLFDYFADNENSFRVLVDGYVTDDDGTGVVHMAPGFGEDDQRVCESNGIVLVCPVDDSGRFTNEVSDYFGTNVFEANPAIISHLKSKGEVVRHDTYDHNYPHCWRTDTPIIYKAVSSWYVKVTEFRDRLVELNQQINWIPSHVRDGQFGRWLEGARDWSISRNRFWGSPIPVWRSDDPAYPRTDVYGSLDEIERDFGVRPDNLHRPTVDDLVRPNPDDPTGKSMMRRVTEVFDCWFESGSMPFAQVHYPFDNRDWFDEHSPADFIVEYIAQTRGWFYTLHVLSVALFDRPAFTNVICHGVVLDHEGRKLSKRLRNYPDPADVFESHGSDPLRWHLMASPILRGGDLRIATDGSDFTEVIRTLVNPIWNAYSFFTLYANADGYRAKLRSDATGVLDRYILAKTTELVESVTGRMDSYDIAGACHDVQSFIDALNNWYIRRSRERFWAPGGGSDGVSQQDKVDAYDTLFTVLNTLVKLIAPLLPMLSDEIFLGLNGPGPNSDASVHLQDWPTVQDLRPDPELVTTMDQVRDVCSVALSLREDNRLRARLPLQRLTIAAPDGQQIAEYAHLIADEVNVKDIEISDDPSLIGSFVLKPNARVLGPRLGKDVQQVIQAAKQGDWVQNEDGTVTACGHVLQSDEFSLALQPRENSVAAPLHHSDAVVELDIEVTDELRAEGMARDLVRMIQQARKSEDLVVTDRIKLIVRGSTGLISSVSPHTDWIAGQVLATATDLQVSDVEPATTDGTHTGSIDGEPVVIEIEVATV
ncbi:MAG: isoleucine--tRNA ligase [Microthrixaceae bacterium]|nr:isoleucine--tRNA ligase [Microthrixaceae bacterium]